MTFTEKANKIFNQAIADYHIKDNIDTPINNPYQEGSIENCLYLKCWIDTVQWHFEDIIRDPQIDPAEALVLKRRIDKSNQDRTDLVEQIDTYFRETYKDVKVLDDARINTESPAWAVDRLSILALKIYHMKEQVERPEASAEHKAKCQAKLDVLLEPSALRLPGTAGRPFYSYRPTLGRYRGWTQIHEGLPTDEDVQRSFNKSCTLQEIKKTE